MVKAITRYEARFAEYFGAERAFAFWKGRIALYAILRALGVGQDDEVIVPGYTCVMAVSPIKYLRARPVYVDIEPHTFNIDPDKVEAAITSRTKVLIAQHTYGYLAEMDALLDIAKRHGLPVVEDCCLALGSTYKGRLAGTFGVAALFSSQWNKPFTTGLGGMAVCHDRDLAGRMARICQTELKPVPFRSAAMLAVQLAAYHALVYPRTTALVRQLFRWLVRRGVVLGSTSMREKRDVTMPDDFFTAMSTVQAASGLRQLRRLDANIAHRRAMAQYCEVLLAERAWPVIHPPAHTCPVLVRYPVRVRDKWNMLAEASRRGIELGAWFESPLHPRETNLTAYDYRCGSCPEAERAAAEVVNLPTHPRASRTTIQRTVDFVVGYTSRLTNQTP